MLWLYCKHHQGGYYFNNVHKNTWNINEADKWRDEPDMRKMEGLCMVCNRTTIFFVSADELDVQRYSDVELCRCGLPAWHQNPSPEFIAQYNAHPVPCRTLPNA